VGALPAAIVRLERPLHCWTPLGRGGRASLPRGTNSEGYRTRGHPVKRTPQNVPRPP
jgi:hypothetical protein